MAWQIIQFLNICKIYYVGVYAIISSVNDENTFEDNYAKYKNIKI